MNFLLAVDGALLLYGAQVVLIGMVTVFAVLGLLWVCLTAFKFVFHDLKSNASVKPAPISKPEEVVVPPVATVSSDDEIVAVIAAAIAAAESEAPGLKFRVVSFRRK